MKDKQLMLMFKEREVTLNGFWKELFHGDTTLANVNRAYDSSHKMVEELEEALCEARKNFEVTQ